MMEFNTKREMNIQEHYRTEFWEGSFTYGPFSEKNWFAIGGINHPLFKALVRELGHLQARGKIDFSRYKLYACGGVLEDWVSWDVDMVLVGPPSLMAYKIMYQLKRLGFIYRVYIDVNLQPSIDGVMLNCGGIDSWDGVPIPMKAWEISNHFVKIEPDGETLDKLFQWPRVQYDLYERDISYPFTKNLDKYREEGYIYRKPILINDYWK